MSSSLSRAVRRLLRRSAPTEAAGFLRQLHSSGLAAAKAAAPAGGGKKAKKSARTSHLSAGWPARACARRAAAAAALTRAPPAAEDTGPAKMDPTTATGVNLLKTGSDPKLGEDKDYPDWLFTLLDARPTTSELERKVAAAKPGERIPVTVEEGERLLTLRRKTAIKGANSAT